MSTIDFSANANFMDNNGCRKAFGGLKGVSDLSCIRESVDAVTGSGSFLITFNTYSMNAAENNLFTHNGNPPLSSLYCNTSAINVDLVEGVSCVLEDVETDQLPLYAECSNHGTCDRGFGICKCATGYHGPACDDTTDSKPIVVHSHDGPFFTGNLMQLGVYRTSSPNFNILEASVGPSASSQKVTTLRGDGLLTHRGAAHFQGGLAVCPVSNKPFTTEHCRSDAGLNASAIASSITTASSAVRTHLLLLTDGRPVHTVSSDGSLRTQGSLSAAADQFLVSQDGTVRMTKALVNSSLEIGQELRVGQGVRVVDSSVTVTSARSIGGDHGQDQRGDPLLQLRYRPEDQSVFRAVLANEEGATAKAPVTTFELFSNGTVYMKALKLQSGGIAVEAGGVSVLSGGLSVYGGLAVRSGGLRLDDQAFSASTLSALSPASHVSGPVLRAAAASPAFSGTLLSLQAESTLPTFTYITALNQRNNSVFSVLSDGSIHSSGGAAFQGSLTVSQHTSLLGGMSLGRVMVTAGADIALICCAAGSHFIVSEDGQRTRNLLTIAAAPDGRLEDGQAILITNRDSQPLRGIANIPPNVTISLVYDGDRAVWLDVRSLWAPTEELRAVRIFEAENDLDVGNVTVSFGRLRLTRLRKGSLLSVGAGGVVIETPSLIVANQSLFVTSLYVDKMSGIDGGDISLQGGRMRNLSLAGVDRLECASATFNAITLTWQKTLKKGAFLAYFDENGALNRAQELPYGGGTGSLAISCLHSNLDGRGHELSNVTLRDVRSLTVGRVTAAALVLSQARGQDDGSLAWLRQGELASTAKSVVFDPVSEVLTVARLSGFSLQGSVRGNGYEMSNISVAATTVTAAAVETTALRVSSLAWQQQQQRGDRSAEPRLVLTDHTGLLSAAADPDMSFGRISATGLFLSGDVDLQGNTVRNGVLDPALLEVKPFGDLTAGRLRLFDLARDTSDGQAVATENTTVLLATAQGDVISKQDLLLAQDGVLTSAGGFNTRGSTTTGSLTISSLATDTEMDSILAVSPEGTVSATTNPILQSLTTRSLKLVPPSVPSLVAIDSSGSLTAVSRSADSQYSAATEYSLTNLNIEHHLNASTIAASSITASDIYLLALPLTADPYQQVLAVDGQTGLISPTSRLLLETVHCSAVLADSVNTTSLSVHTLLLDPPAAAAAPFTAVTAIDSTGRLHTPDEIHLDILTARQAALATLTTGSITLKDPDGASGSLSIAPLVRTASGLVQPSDELLLRSLRAEHTFSDAVTTNRLRLQSSSPSSSAAGTVSGVLLTDKDGFVSASRDLQLSSVTTEQLQVTAALSVAGLALLSPLLPLSDAPFLLLSDASGVVSAVPCHDLISRSVSSLPSPPLMTYANLTVTDQLIATHLYLGMQSSQSDRPLGEGRLLGLGSDGEIFAVSSDLSLQQLRLDRLHVEGSLDLIGKLSLQGIGDSTGEGPSKLLIVGNTGDVTAAEAVVVQDGVLTARHLRAEQLSGASDASALQLTGATCVNCTLTAPAITLPAPTPHAGAAAVSMCHLVMRSQQDGQLIALDAMLADQTGTLAVSAIQPLPSSLPNSLLITNATLSSSNMHGGNLTAIQSISAASLEVSGFSEFGSQVFIGGSLSVHGSVIATGPYMESSDIRFKKDVQRIQKALSKVDLLNPVTFLYDSEAYPEQGFPDSRQMGFVADEVMAVVPELVDVEMKSGEGFKSVAYARVSALLAAAVIELHEEMRTSLEAMRVEMKAMRGMLQEVMEDQGRAGGSGV